MTDDPTHTSHDDPKADPDLTLGPGAGPRSGLPFPPRIGTYRILRVLGQGGMGVVYEAEQDNPRRTVALKVIRAEYGSTSLLRRFEQEAQLLAQLQHPGIAQIYDAGTEDTGRGPQPYFAMELIRGRTLLEHAAHEKLGHDERLALFVRVCEAVQHAHAKGIIHRDLKPGNILVDGSGQPKILDFGVARATDSDIKMTTVETNMGQLIGTLPYMSPEQVAANPGDLDTRSDIYALGVILYELLAGRPPYVLTDRMLHEAVRVIREDDPTPLSTVSRVYRGDIETIVGKALEKERERRYQSAAEMGADIGRYLRNEPIRARRPSTFYQLGKFARRNRVLVFGVAAVFVALLLGVVASTWYAVRATRAEKLASARLVEAQAARKEAEESALRAKEEGAKAVAVNAFLQEMLGSASPEEAMGRDLSVREMLDESAKKVEVGSLGNQPELEAAVRSTIGRAYEALGLYDVAKPHLERSLALLRRLPKTETSEVLAVMTSLGDAHFRLQERAKAEAVFREALAIARGITPGDPNRQVKALCELAFFLDTEQRADEAERLYRESLAILRGLSHEEPLLLSTTVTGLGSILKKRNDLPEAESLLKEGLELRRKSFGDLHPDVSTSFWLLGDLEKQRGDFDAAERYLDRALEIRRKVLGPDHAHVALVLVSLADLEVARSNFAAARPLLDEALRIRKKAFGAEHAAIAATLADLMDWHARQQDYASAVAVGRQSLAMWKRLRGKDDPEVADCENELARWVQRTGDLSGAEEMYRDALRIERKRRGPESADVALLLANIAGVLFPKGDLAGASAAARESLAMYRRVLAAGHPSLAYPLRQYSFLLQKQKAWDEALPLEREAYEIDRRNRPEGSPDNAGNLAAIAVILLARKSWAEAEGLARECLAIREKAFPPDDWRLSSARSMLGEALGGQGKDGEAEPLLVASHRALEGSKAPPDLKTQARDRLVRFYTERGKTEEAKGVASGDGK